MILDLQKASVLKRASAFLLDLILFSILAVGFAVLVSTVTKYDTYAQKQDQFLDTYAEQYLGMKLDDFEKLTDDEQKPYEQAYLDMYKALNDDKEFSQNFSMIVSLSLLMVSLGIFFAMLVLEFIVPLILKNGQTVGKKIFGIAVIRPNGVKANHISLFIRALLGKYTIETMIPVLLFMMMSFGMIGIVAPIILLGICILEIVVFSVSGTNSLIHDVISDTVSVDMASQMIFDDDECLIAYKARLAAEAAERKPY